MLAVYRFYTVYKPAFEEIEHTNPVTGETSLKRKPLPGQTREVHMVEYGPLGSDKTRVTASVESLRRVRDMSEAQQNPSILMAAQRWAAIEPYYAAWLQGQQPTPDGTPLAAWSGVSPEQAESLKMRGIHTVQQLAALNDSHFEKYGIQGLRALADNAKRFIATLDSRVLEDKLAEKDLQIASLTDTVEEMKTMLAELMAGKIQTGEGGHSEQTENARPRRKAS